MSYGVHIRRVQGDTLAITLEEWLAYANSDSEMRLKGNVRITSPKGDVIEWDAPRLVEWTDPQTRSTAYFDFRKSDGCLSVGNPSPATLAKMFKVARSFGAVVQGDEGEYYDSLGRPQKMPTS